MKVHLFMQEAVEVRLLGAFTIQQGDKSLPLPASGMARALLAYLFFHRQRVHARAVLVGIFWPDLPEERARRALSQALWHIRRSLPDMIKVNSQEISLETEYPIRVDTENFDSLTSQPEATRDRLFKGINLYQGDLLEGDYEDWVLLERERLRERYLLALETLIQLEKSAGNYQSALDLSLKLTNADPLREAAHRDVMRLHFLLDHPEAALQQFEVCKRILQDELDVIPEAKTLVLVDEISRQSRQNLPPFLPRRSPKEGLVNIDASPSIPLALTGRHQERDAFLLCLEETIHGHGGVVLLEGEAGVGKSRLLKEIARDAEWRNMQVSWGYGRELEASQPFGLLVEALENGLTPLRCNQVYKIVNHLWLQVLSPLLPALSQQFPDLQSPATLPPTQQDTRRVEALINLLSGWSQAKALVLILEDLHWADQDTLNLLPALASRLKETGVLIIGSFRSEEARARPALWERFQALDRSGLRLRVQLPRLDFETCSELIRRCLGLEQPAPMFEKRIHLETDGNPLFVLETLRSLQDEGLLQRDETGAWHTPWDESTADYVELPLPPLVERVISRRLSGLRTQTRRALNVASVLGSQIDFNLFATLNDIDTPQLLEVTRELVQRHFLEETGYGYRFSHDKILQVVFGEIALEERMRLHNAAARYLEAHAPDNLAALAHHFQKAQVWNKAASYNQFAGDSASALFANQKAILHYAQALDALDNLGAPEDTDQRITILVAREAVYNRIGERESQKADLLTLDNLLKSSAARAAQALRWANFYEATSNYADVIKAAQLAIELATQENDSTTVATAQILWGRALNMQANFDEAKTKLEDALQTSRSAHDQRLEAASLIALARMYFDLQNRYAEALECSQQALSTFRQLGDREEEANALNLICSILSDLGELERSIQERQEVLRLRREIGDRRGAAMALYSLGVSSHDKGNDVASLQYSQAATDIAEAIGEQRVEAYGRTYLGLLTEETAPAESIQQYSRALQIRRQIGQHALAVDTLAGLARASLQLGEVNQAKAYIAEALDWVEQNGAFAVGDIGLVYLAAYRVFNAANETTRMRQVIQAAYEDLMSRADTMPDEASRARFLRGLPQHERVLTLYQDLHSSKIIVSLPDVKNPDITVNVTWTLSTPEDEQIRGKVEIRHRQLKRLLKEARQQGAEPGYKHLADALGVGLRTIERDMAELKKTGVTQ